MPDNTVQFLPFHAINEFMRADFRLTVIKRTLTNLRNLPQNEQDKVNRLIKRSVKIPGFRNSEKAPTAVKILPTSKVFESDPNLVAAILSAWSELNPELRSHVFQVLKERSWFFFPDDITSASDLPSINTEKDWGILPETADRTVLPGFLIYWPENQDFEEIYTNFTEAFPDAENSIDEVSLMTVWITNRLPYHVQSDEEEPIPTPQSTE